MHKRSFVTAFLLFFSTVVQADLIDRPDGHAPIGVMGDHVHRRGELMLSYRLMLMEMDGLQDGTQSISTDNLFSNTSFMMAPENMKMWMHMLGAMYGLTDDWTVMIMLPYLSNEMTMSRKMQNDQIEGRSSGIGDVSLTGMYHIFEKENQRLQVNLGLYFPTGSIEESREGHRLGYPMQIGSGSYAVQPTLNYSYFGSRYSLGAQAGLKQFIDENKADYKRGPQYSLSAWGAYNVNDGLSSSVRLLYKATDPMTGSDQNIHGMMSPTHRSEFQHGNVVFALVGLNLLGVEVAKGHRIGLEFGAPIYQDLSGPQMKSAWVGTLGWQKVF